MGGNDRKDPRGIRVLLALLALVAAAVFLLLLLPDRTPEKGPPTDALPLSGDSGTPPPAVAYRGGEEGRSAPTPNPYAPKSARIRGQVSLPAWADFPSSAVVTLLPQPGTSGPRRSAALGPGRRAFDFPDLPFGNWKVELAAPGFERFSLLVSTDPEHADARLLLPLRPTSRLAGVVYDATGAPAPDVEVTATLQLEDHLSQARPLTARTDPQGKFQMPSARPGRYRIHAGPPRNPLGEVQELQLVNGEGWTELHLPATGAMRVRVVELGEDTPVSGARVVAQRFTPGQSGYSDSGMSDEQGTLLFLPE